jgi:hypothetical protein
VYISHRSSASYMFCPSHSPWPGHRINNCQEHIPWNPLGNLFSLLKMHINIHLLYISLSLGLQTNFMTISHLIPTRLRRTHLLISNFPISLPLRETKNCKAPQWVFSPSSSCYHTLEAKYFPQHFPIKHLQTGSIFLNLRLLVNY